MLPFIPDTFRPVIRQIKTEEGFKDDPLAVKQLEIIRDLLQDADRVITATDTSREGQLIARNLYGYLGFKGKTERLWFSSLTDKAIREAFRELKPDSEYDSLYLAGKARREADWLIGYNSSLALGLVAGKRNYSLGRVQTPALALVCGRYLANRDFVGGSRYRLELSAVKDGKELIFECPDIYAGEEDAATARGRIASRQTATVMRVEKREIAERPPLLYDLSSLLKEANNRIGLTVGQTMSILQKLYEEGYISYPRTSCRYIRKDMQEGMSALLAVLKTDPRFARHAEALESKVLNFHAVDDDKAALHHAIVITENRTGSLSPDEQAVYSLIAGRMLEAFSPNRIEENRMAALECGGIRFENLCVRTMDAGWKSIYGDAGTERDTWLPALVQGEELPVTDIAIRSEKKSPLPLFTEASLLCEMEECGLGTPTTRAGIIELLVARRYVERQGCNLLPTPKGLEVYEAVKDKLIADTGMTDRWERDLRDIEQGRLDAGVFMENVREFTKRIVSELSDIKMAHPGSLRYRCPKCERETITLHRKVARCNDPDCAFLLFRLFNGRELTDGQMIRLLEGKRTSYLEFTSKRGKMYEASLKMDENYKIGMKFKDNRPKE